MGRSLTLTLTAVTCLATALPTTADSLTLEAIDSGFVTEKGGASKFDGTSPMAPGAKNNYSVGWELHFADGGTGGPGGIEYMHKKNYFVFDLSGVIEPITSATLLLYTPPMGYESGDASELFEIGGSPDVLADLGTLASVGVPADVDAAKVALATELFMKLADTLGPLPPDPPTPMKTVLASAMITIASEDDFTPVVFTPEGIDYLNAFLGGSVVLAGAVPSVDPMGMAAEQPFGFTAPLIGLGSTPAPMLDITTIPEPSAIVLLGAALPMLRRARKRN